MSIQISQGDVFVMPLGEGVMGLGQVVDVLDAELYLVAYGEVWHDDSPPEAKEVIRLTPVFATLSLDAKLWNGDWTIIGNIVENLSAIQRPLFKIRQGGSVLVESHDGSKSRAAIGPEEEMLRYRKTVAPIRLQKAVQAHNRMIEWNDLFEEMKYTYAQACSSLEV